ncbi:MAG: SRPBCC family protein [Acidimicrobiia bacterium]|nr:SRPBCC family protein [Acidimicrobiia bacterium]
MIELSRQREIEADPATVWAVLSDFGSISAWAANVDHSCLMSAQTGGVGARRRIQAGPLTLVETVTEWEPEQMLAYEISGLPPLVQGVTNRWQIDATTANASRVTLSTNIRPGQRPPQRLAARALGRRLMQASDQMLDGLQARATSGGSQR